MALGNLVAGALAYSGSGGAATTVSPAYPSGILATDVVILIVGQKPNTANGGTVTTPTGWTLQDSLTGAGGYGTTLAVDTGNTNLYIYTWNTPVAGQTGNLAVTLGNNNIAWAFMARIPTDGGTVVFGSADGSRTTAPTSGTAYTVTLTNGATATNFASGDIAVWAMTIPTDVLNANGFSAHTISATGTTFGTPAEINEASSGTNSDIGGYSAWARATAGSSTAAPVVGATATGTVTNVRGPIVLIRIRELPFINAEVGSFTYTGQAITDTVARNLNAEDAAFTYTGENATLEIDRTLNAEAGSFSYTGQNANLAVDYTLNLEAGAFTYTGENAELTVTTAAKIIDAEVGTFTYTGQDASFKLDLSVNAEVGSFTYTGENTTLDRTYSFDAEVGVFTYTGEDADLLYVPTRTIDAEAGTFNYTGQDATLNRTYLFDAEVGTFDYTGENATLLLERFVDAEAGSFAYTGQPVTFEAVGAFDSGAFSIVGEDAIFVRTTSFNAQQGAFGEADPYVDQGYVNPGYVTGLTATLGYSRSFFADAGVFNYTGQPATFTRGFLYPPENQVLAGVVYGPDGIYVGTYVCPPAQNKQILYIFDD